MRQLLTHFEPYAEIPKIAELQATVGEVSATLDQAARRSTRLFMAAPTMTDITAPSWSLQRRARSTLPLDSPAAKSAVIFASDGVITQIVKSKVHFDRF